MFQCQSKEPTSIIFNNQLVDLSSRFDGVRIFDEKEFNEEFSRSKSVGLSENSYLFKVLGCPQNKTAKKNNPGVSGVARKKSITDKPIVFHKIIKSSGYSQSAMMSPHELYLIRQKKLREKRLAALGKLNKNIDARVVTTPQAVGLEYNPVSRSNSAGKLQPKVQSYESVSDDETESNGSDVGDNLADEIHGSNIRQYPVRCNLINSHQPNNDFFGCDANSKSSGVGSSSSGYKPAALFVRYSSDASSLLAGYSDGSFSLLKLPISKWREAGNSMRHYTSHTQALTSLQFGSHGKKLIVSSSLDGTVKLWSGERSDRCMVNITHTYRSPDCRDNLENGAKSNVPINAAITQSGLYYLDKFITLSHRNILRFYYFEKNEGNDNVNGGLGRLYREQNCDYKYKCALKYTYGDDDSHTLTSFHACNRSASPWVIASTSDRKLLLYDTNAGSTSPVAIDSSLTRAAYSIIAPEPTIHTANASDCNYNLFASSALLEGVCFHDIRLFGKQSSQVGQYRGHCCRSERLGGSFSPCMRYFATGSEDGSCHIIDIRGGFKVISVINFAHRDVVSDLCFSPLFPQMVTCSFDGAVKFFVESTS